MSPGDRKQFIKLIFFSLSIFFVTTAHGAAFTPAAPAMNHYYKTPPYISSAEKPSVMLILDSSGSMNSLAYRGSAVQSVRKFPWGMYYCSSSRGGDFDPLNEYFGYFDPKTYYVYDNTDVNNSFFEVCSGTVCADDTQTWSGNFLNWLAMRRVDIAKQVLTGGKVDADATPNPDILEAEPYPDRDQYKAYDDSVAVTDLNGSNRHMTPWHQPMVTTASYASPQYIRFDSTAYNFACGGPTFDIRTGGNLTYNGTSDFKIRVKVEASKLINGTVEGVIQQTATDTRYGLTIFDDGSDGVDWNGGEVLKYVGTANKDIIDAINDVHPNSWTPLAETLWTVVGYFQQNNSGTGSSGPHYESDAYTINNDWDPFYFNNKQKKIPCSDGFVVLITDGESTQDLNIPSWLRDYDNDGVSTGSYGSNGSDYLDDVAFYAHTNDLRDDATEPEMVGDQTLTLYPIFAFGSGASLLEKAAINGGFIDKNNDGRPNTLAEELAITDLTLREWDHDNDPNHLPDNYAAAENGKDLVDALKNTLGSIKKRLASGTAASVISASRAGQGAIYQATFFPSRTDGENREVTWIGNTHSLFVDAYGNMREDTLKNNQIDMIDDYIVKMFYDNIEEKTKARRYKDLDGDGNLDVNEDVDGDGCLDVIEIDHDGDGHFDVIEDKNGDGDCNDDEDYDNDGHLDVIEPDLDGDGHADVNEDVDLDLYLDRGEDVICNHVLDYYEIDNNSNGILDPDEDLDGDGYRDIANEDLDGDCRFDTINEDLDGDGNFDNISEDLNLNRLFDLDADNNTDGDCTDFGDVDTNGNNICDTYEDLDGDGRFDIGEDTNNNRILDIGEDLDGDGILDLSEDLDGDNNFDIGEDLNLNGIIDTGEDLDLDGTLDPTEDLDGDSHHDRGEDVNCNGSLEDREDVDNDGNFDVDEDTNGNGSLDGSEDLDNDGHLDVGEDTNCNGVQDAGEVDLNGSGAWEMDEDIDNDNNLDVAETDVDGDGNADVAEDLDGDGNLDRGEDLNCNNVIDAGEDIDNSGTLAATEDLDGDGTFDRFKEDINDDGNLDVYEDLDNDGNLDIFEDFDGDGRFEPVCEEDVNGNGLLDAGEDLDGDGHRDCGGDLNADGDCADTGEFLIKGVCERDEDVDGDGNPDLFEDLDGDGVLDLVEDANHDGIANDPDLNGNGVWDIKEDLDNDGHIDVNEDIDGDTTWDFTHEDIDNDCNLDVQEDMDGDNTLDLFNEDLDNDGHLDDKYEDTNNNCVLDTVSEDQDGDGRLDTAEWDIDGDGNVDGHEDLDNDCNLDVLEDLDGDGKLDYINEDGSDGSIPNGILDAQEADVDGDGNCDLVADINEDDVTLGCDFGVAKFDTADEDQDGDGRLDTGEPVVDTIDITSLRFLWSAAEQLADSTMAPETQAPSYGTSAPERYIFTYIDENNDKVVDSGEVLTFDSNTLASSQYFGYFLGTNTGSYRDINGDSSINNDDIETLVDFIRGKEFPGITSIRSRQIRIDTNYDGVEDNLDSVVTWRLGDIIQSSPTVVHSPAENYDLLYRNDDYRRFKKAYAERRTMVYTGSNDGLFHAFNGGFFIDHYVDRSTTPATVVEDKFWRNCYRNPSFELICTDSSLSPELGQEMWAYAPYNLLPHLQWLTRQDYSHVYYSDLRPRIFDAQLWPDNPLTDKVHVGGWGTVLIGGMRFGGGPIQINADEGLNGTDLRTLRSAYFVFDITDPEQPPALLGEFVVDEDTRPSFTTVWPAVIPIFDQNATANAWGVTVNLEWYLLLGSGPTNLDGESTQEGRAFLMKLKNYQCNGQGINCTNKTLGVWEDNGRGDGNDYFLTLGEANSFMGDPSVIDYQLGNPANNPGSFMADVAYFGTVAGNFVNGNLDTNIGEDLNNNAVLDYGEDANGNGKVDIAEDTNNNGILDPSEDVGGWTGKMHRIVIDDRVNGSGEEPTDADTWSHNLFYDPKQPIVAAPLVGLDEDSTFWVYFGTGRFFDELDRDDTAQMNYYGITEPRASIFSLTGNPSYVGSKTVPARSKTDLLETSNVKVFENDSPALALVEGVPGVTNFRDLESLYDYDTSVVPATLPTYAGWYFDLQSSGERNVGQGVLLGEISTFTGYTPSNVVCESEGTSDLYALYYRTGTSYWTDVIGLDSSDTRYVSSEWKSRVKNKLTLGPGLVASPNIFRGRSDGTTAFVQSSTGGITEVKQLNPGIIKSGKTSWKQAQ